MGALAGLSATAALHAALPGAALGQDAPKPPAEPAGTVPNKVVLAAKDAAVKPHSDRPLTASATAEYLGDDVTPTSRHFIRNNLFTPDFDEARHTVEITGLVDRPMTLTLADLRSRFPQVSAQAMIECAGSGRSGFTPMPRGTPWPISGGMSCSQWTGVRLADVLRAAGVRSGAVHVAFSGADFGALPTIPKVARSVPLEKAMERHTLLAFGMNGEATKNSRPSAARGRACMGRVSVDKVGVPHRCARCAAQRPLHGRELPHPTRTRRTGRTHAARRGHD